MKRTLSLWLGVLAFAAIPMFAQEAGKPMGKIHGHVSDPTGMARHDGTVSVTMERGEDKATFPVNQNGDYAGEVAPGTYTLVYRAPDTPKNQRVDQFDNVKIVAGEDAVQDFDMSRAAYIKTLTTEQQKQLDEVKKKNAEALKTNSVVKQLNADLTKAEQDIREAAGASETVKQQLGANATKQDILAKVNEIKTQKFTEVEQLMQKDTPLKPDASILWTHLGEAQVALKKFPDAETSLKKAIEVESAAKKVNPEWLAKAQSTLGEAYARQAKVPEAQAAFDDAAKSNPPQAGLYYKNEAIIFFQTQNTDAQLAAADKAIAVAPEDPKGAIVYYIKANALVGKTTEDTSTHKLVAPPGCMESYQKYVSLDPNGQFATEVKGILQQFSQPIPGATKSTKRK